jgi:vancomycin resistance protein YoaR
MTTITAALSRPRLLLAAGPMRSRFLVGFFATLVVGIMMLVGASAGVAVSHTDRVMRGVSIAGVPVGGMDRASAIARLEAQLPSLTEGTLLLQIDEETRELALADLGRTYDIEATVDAALAVARSGNPLADGVTRLRTLAHPTTVAGASVTLDPAVVDEIVAGVIADYDRPPVDASVRLRKLQGFVARPAVVGITVDAEALRQALSTMLATSRGDVAIDVPAMRADPAVSTRDGMAAAIAARWMSQERLLLTGGGKKHNLKISSATLASLMTFGQLADGGWGASVDEKALAKLLRPIADRVGTEPVDASFLYGPNGVVGVVAAQPGSTLRLKVTVGNVVAALGQRAAGSSKPSAALAIGIAKPNVTTAEARQIAPVMQRISSWTTFYEPGEGNFWNANIHIPAWDLDGKVIGPGEWFEFWQGIGPVTLERGYGYGGAIIGGRSVPNGALAGGICSTSTTLFNAAMRAGLEIGERVNHSYYIERYPMGLDATVLQTDTWETDMTFRNDTDSPIVIRSYTGNGWVRFEIWGVPNGRTVTLSAPATSNHGTAIETTVVNPDLAPGTSKRVEYPHNGFDAVVTRWVRDANGNLIHEDTWYSHYRTVNGITEVGPRRSS